MPPAARPSLWPVPHRLPSVVALLVALVAVLALGSSDASAASATRTVKKAMWGPAQVDGVSQFPAYRDLGVEQLPQPGRGHHGHHVAAGRYRRRP